MRSLILAWDCDDTIFNTNWPVIHSMRADEDGYSAKDCINDLYNDGHQIIIWTCRHEDIYADAAKDYLQTNEIKYHRFNENCPERVAFFGNDCRKIGADLYIDDKGILGLPTFREIYRICTELALKED